MGYKEILSHATLESLIATTNCDIVWIFKAPFLCVNKYLIHIHYANAKKSYQCIINIKLHFQEYNVFQCFQTNFKKILHIIMTYGDEMYND